MLRAAVALAASLAIAGPAAAHRAWDDGSPVEKWIKDSCCGEADMHWFTADQVRMDNECWHVQPEYPSNGGCIPRDKPECQSVEEMAQCIWPWNAENI